MSHLTLEALARLVEEDATTREQEHLAGCERCRNDLAALRDQTEALGALPKLEPPPDQWPRIRDRLRHEALLPARPSAPRWVRAAAAITLFLAGGATGYAARSTLAPAPPTPVAAAPSSSLDPAGRTGERLAGGPEAPAAAPASADDLSDELERTQAAFAAALDRYMMATGTDAPDPAARLAALDNIVLTTAQALNESPADPVINSYHLTAVAQRNELLRQLAGGGEPVF
ncbi:MAG: hypothetical protein ACOCUW_03515 [Gemmatimonadota bacterium]